MAISALINRRPNRYFDPLKPHHTRRGFRNLDAHDAHKFRSVLRWAWERRRLGFPVERQSFPLLSPDLETLRNPSPTPTLTWIGHSTFLLQLGGWNILTDPHFSERASPVSFAGPKRLVPPAIALADLPGIHLVLISHNHYDHLDRASLVELVKQQADSPPLILVPLGLSNTLGRWGLTTTKELDWWESLDSMDGGSFTAVPVQHFSARGPYDRNRSLWSGWVVELAGLRLFFSGDSGYSPNFKRIQRRLGPMDIALLPIGAYEPRWFMRSMHINPEEAVQAHLDLQARLSVAMHWGTFILTDEPLDEPPQRLRAAMEDAGLPADDFRVLQHGETLRLVPASAPTVSVP